jgi:hypothetical protein
MTNRYQNIQTTKNSERGIPFYVNAIYPDISQTNNDSYVITTAGDRLDLMSLDFYGDSGYWWVIASANALPGDSLFPPIGMQLRLPENLSGILSQYKSVNTVR